MSESDLKLIVDSIDSYGLRRAADAIGVSPTLLSLWKHRKRTLQPEKLRELVTLLLDDHREQAAMLAKVARRVKNVA